MYTSQMTRVSGTAHFPTASSSAYYTYGDVRGLGRENFIEIVKEQGVMDNLVLDVQGVMSNE